MSDFETQRDDAHRGDKARAILENSLWQEAWEKYRNTLLAEFEACKSDDVSRMQQLKQLLLAGQAAKSHLESVLANGEFAKKNIEFMEKQGRVKRVLQALT